MESPIGKRTAARKLGDGVAVTPDGQLSSVRSSVFGGTLILSNDLDGSDVDDEYDDFESVDMEKSPFTQRDETTPHSPMSVAPFDPFLHAGKRLGKDVIILTDIQKTYPVGSRVERVTAVRGVSLCENSEFSAIRAGEFVMIRGKSGCGKTTLLNIMGTIDRPTGGELVINGVRITKRSRDSFLAKLRLQTIGFVFQTFNLLSTLSALENVELPMILLGKLNKRAARKRATELLKTMGMQDRVGHLPSELSGGEQQRVTIARSLANDPPILLLDEPTGSLATAQTIEIMNLLLNINRTKGVTMVMVSHNPDVECYADRILYVRDGRIVKQAINDVQRNLHLKQYLAYLSAKERESKEKMDAELLKERDFGVPDIARATASGRSHDTSEWSPADACDRPKQRVPVLPIPLTIEVPDTSDDDITVPTPVGSTRI